MASVFLSYDHEDAAQAAPIASALENAGHSVWWDRQIAGGAEYNSEIEGAVERADAVVVLWSKRSVLSPWVRDEAAEGRDHGKLVPVTLDGAKPPMGFRQYQTIEFSGPMGNRLPRNFQSLVDAIARLAAATEQPVPQAKHVPAIERRNNGIKRPFVIIVVLAILVGAGLVAWRVSQPSSSVPLIAVAPAIRSADAESSARNILVKLGSLRSARTDSVRLIGPTAGKSPDADFVFEAASSTDGKNPRGNLALLAGKDRSVLWSNDFELPGGNQSALEQSMAYTAGHVLDCALQGSAGLDQQTLKLFLNGCALFAEKYRTDPRGVAPLFLQVIESAPRFQPAWRKLLLAEALFTRTERLLSRVIPGALPSYIAAARKLNPKIPEIYLAESVLVPITDYARRAELLERAVRLDPDNPDLLLMRAEFLLSVGRMREVVDDANRAVELNPLSAGLRSHMISDLAYAGRIDAAQQELRRAEQLWPDSTAINDARFRLNYRYGDARLALTMLKSGALGSQPMVGTTVEFLAIARMEPTESNVRRAISAAKSRASTDSRSLADLVQASGEFQRENELYEVLLRWPRTDLLGAVGESFFRPPLRKFRQDPRFMIIANRIGLVEYWRTSRKWPDFCLEADQPYDCKAEAAKVAR